MATHTCGCRDLVNANSDLDKANRTIETLKSDIRRLKCEIAQNTHTTTHNTTMRNQTANLTSISLFPSKTQPTTPPPRHTCSTPLPVERWTDVVKGRKGVPRKCLASPLELSNNYSILASNKDTDAHTGPLPHQVRRPLPRREERPKRRPDAPRRITRERPHRAEPRQPSTVLVGSSMVRHVILRDSQTWCLPGARVTDVQSNVPAALLQYPSASTVVVHVGSNDIQLQQSEKLKSDFISLINTLKNTGKKYTISGPIPSVCFSDSQFSRIYQLHVWLMRLCLEERTPFVDNFSCFWKRRNLFARDGRHLNRAGAHLFATNLEVALEAHRSSD